LSPRPKSDKSKTRRFELRITEETAEKLDYCASKMNVSKAKVIETGIDLVKAEVEKK